MIAAALTGFFTSLSLILAIGAQNAFVLRQGLLRSHVFALCLFCGLSDAILISLGVTGFGYVVKLAPWLPTVMALAGAAFLIVYGATRLYAVWVGEYALQIKGESSGLWPTLAVAAALTWLNPHVYLDTLGLIGAVSTHYVQTSEKWAFGIAATFASVLFFFSLGYGARLLAPYMKSPHTWRILDALIGLTMFAIAAKLLLGI
ncbi:MAG: LysE/ArgO family amino acid transporter [Rhodobacterales bacterium]